MTITRYVVMVEYRAARRTKPSDSYLAAESDAGPVIPEKVFLVLAVSRRWEANKCWA
jgi:hypothetical protein